MSKTYDSESFPSAGTCHVCTCIRRLFIENDVEIDLEDWESEEIRCEAHGPLLSWVMNAFREEADDLERQGAYRLKSRGEYTFRFFRKPGDSPEIQLCDYKERSQWSRKLFLFSPEDARASRLSGRGFDPQWLNLQVARQWLETCVAKHGNECDNTFKIPPCFPAYLIDTQQQCIAPGRIGIDYVALSYRWSNKDSFKTDKSNFKEMATPGILSANRFTNIPSTIKNAMHVVSSLGERYLWVDSLCLISDDKEHMSEQLQLMGSIYACAKLTIIATDGDAWDGLHGIEEKRELPNAFLWLDSTTLVVRDLPPLSERLSSCSEYFRRGWTYQEYFLSRRRLIFGKRQIHWSCSCAELHEDDPDAEESHDDMTEYFNIPNLLAGMSDIDELEKLMREYHVRKFTCEEDALPGITGLLALLSYTTTTGNFICGLPERWFDAALLWHCQLGCTQLGGYRPLTFLEQRVPSENLRSSLPGAVLPTWSWISWRGNMLLLLEEEDYQLPESLGDAILGPKMITTPITRWFSSKSPGFNNNERTPIRSFPDRNHDERSVSECLAQGWLKESCNLKAFPE